MSKDTITLKLTLNADFQTIQTVRYSLNSDPIRAALVSTLRQTVADFLHAHDINDFDLSAVLQVSRVSKTAKTTCSPPILKDGSVSIWDYEYDRQIDAIAVDGPHWVDFLSRSTGTSFHYEHPTGSFTAVRENRRGRQVWYAHRRLRGTLKRFYLGVPQTLTGAKLADTARKVSRWAQSGLTV